MSLIDFGGDPWLQEHEACEKLFREISAQLSERDGEVASSPAYGYITASVRVRLGQLSSEVQQLREKLSIKNVSTSITPHEAERRTRLVEHLESNIRHLQHRFANRPIAVDRSRSQLLGWGSGGQVFADMGTTGWGNEPENTSDAFDVGRAQRTTEEVIREQNAGLEELSKIISRQKEIGKSIGAEVDVHNEILDDLTEGIDRTTVGLINETQQVRTIARKDSTCGYWVVIVVLFIAIVVVALV